MTTIRADRTLEDRARFGLGSDTQDDNTDPATDETPNTAEGVIGSGNVEASDVNVDSTTLVGVGTTLQAVLEELDDAAAAAGAVYVMKAADETVASSTVHQADDELLFTPAASKNYAIHAVIYTTAVGGGGGLVIDPAKATNSTYKGFNKGLKLSDGSVLFARSVGAGTATNDFQAGADAADGAVMEIEGILVCAANVSGTFVLKWAQSSSNVAGTVVKAGSYLSYKLLN